MEFAAVILLSVIASVQVSSVAAVKRDVEQLIPTEPFPSSIALVDDYRYHLFWKSDATTITFEVHVKAKGWIGFGMSPNGGMPHSDMVTGWVKDGKVYFQDRYVGSSGVPTVDESQDWELLEGRETASHTILKFRRPLYTCDPRDRNVTTGTIRLMFAYTDVDPSSEDTIAYHGSTRGQKSIALFNKQKRDLQLPKDAFYKDFVNTGVLVPHDARTTYWCHGFHVPDFKGQKHHLIRVEPIITPGNEGTAHHILLYGCFHEPTDLKGRSEESFDCFVPNMPWDQCVSVFAGWAVGGKDFNYPAHAGYPMGDGGVKYIRMVTHYDNPSFTKGVYDFSGLRMWFTPTLRQYDAGVLDAGIIVSALGHILPVGYPSITSIGLCSKECLQEGMGNQTEINVFATFLHEHLLGTGVRVRHFRDGVEKSPLDEDMTYDFNYQEMRVLNPEVKVMKGDDLVVECQYNTEGEKDATLGGLGTDNEMCLAFILYYPRIDLSACQSMPTQNQMARELNLKYRLKTEFIPPISNGEWAVLTEGPHANLTFTDYIKKIRSFPNDAYMKRYQRAITTGDVKQFCMKDYSTLLKADGTVTRVPIVTAPYIPEEKPCVASEKLVADPKAPTLNPAGSRAPISGASGILLLLTAMLLYRVFL